MHVRVEFYGVVRHRAGIAGLTVSGETLGDVVRAIRAACPALASICRADGRLETGTLANLDGLRFVTDPDTPIRQGGVVLILSADVGG
jgi:molybdopterin converting factor small subunit